jgi:hypothetical protein
MIGTEILDKHAYYVRLLSYEQATLDANSGEAVAKVEDIHPAGDSGLLWESRLRMIQRKFYHGIHP